MIDWKLSLYVVNLKTRESTKGYLISNKWASRRFGTEYCYAIRFLPPGTNEEQILLSDSEGNTDSQWTLSNQTWRTELKFLLSKENLREGTFEKLVRLMEKHLGK